jgi:hypothetical protein
MEWMRILETDVSVTIVAIVTKEKIAMYLRTAGVLRARKLHIDPRRRVNGMIRSFR